MVWFMYQMIFCLQHPRTWRIIEIKKEMLVSVIATSLKPLEIKIWNFFKFKCFKLTKRLVQ